MKAMNNIPSRKEIGDCLQKLRVAAGYDTAKDFAVAVGFNVDTYTGYEQGKGMFSYEKAWIMADALNCPIDALGGRKPPVTYSDKRQEAINAHFDTFNDEARTDVYKMVERMSHDPHARIEKDGGEHAILHEAVGA